MTPLALGQYSRWNLLDREVRESVRFSAKGSTADEQTSIFTNLIAQLGKLLASECLGRDEEEIALRGPALLPVKLIAGSVGKAHNLAHGFGEHSSVVQLANDEIAKTVSFKQ